MKVLKLSAQGLPQSWISLEQAVIHYAANEVRWESGGEIAVFRGGHNAITGQQSIIADTCRLFEVWRAGKQGAYAVTRTRGENFPFMRKVFLQCIKILLRMRGIAHTHNEVPTFEMFLIRCIHLSWKTFGERCVNIESRPVARLIKFT